MIITFLILISGVWAYNSGLAPSVMGHSLNEVEMPNCLIGQVLQRVSGGWGCGSSNSLPSCSDGQVLKYSGSSWECASVKQYSSTQDCPDIAASNCGVILYCGAGEMVVGGGCGFTSSGTQMKSSYPFGQGWLCDQRDTGGSSSTSVLIICV